MHHPEALDNQQLSPLAQAMRDLQFTLCGPQIYRNPGANSEFTIEQQLLKPLTKLKSANVSLQFTREEASARQINGQRLFGVSLIVRNLSDDPKQNTHYNFFYFGGINRSAGPNHGLAIIDQHGTLIYFRNPGHNQKPESGWLIPEHQRSAIAA